MVVVGWFEASGVVGAAVLSALGFLPSCRRRWFMFCAPFWSCFNAFSFFIIGVVCGVKRCLPWLVVVDCCLPWLVGRSFLLVPCISAVSPREGGREGGTTPDERKERKTPNSNIQYPNSNSKSNSKLLPLYFPNVLVLFCLFKTLLPFFLQL